MGKKQIRTREPLRLAETVCGWHNPPGARKCEEIPYALIRLMTSHYQWDINAQTKHAPPRLGAPVSASRYARLLRRGRPVLALYAALVALASAQAARALFHFCLLPRAYALG